MPLIDIKNIVSFSPNYGVLIKREAINHNAEEVLESIRLAWSYMDDEYLVDACCGGNGELAKYSKLTFDEFLEIRERLRIQSETKTAKKLHTKTRRTEFNTSRSQIVLALIENGVPYTCSHSGCGQTIDLTVDHIVPLSRGGSDELSNLQFLCRSHNSSKGDKHYA